MDRTSREAALALDAHDPLAPFRHQFVVPDDTVVYLDGNSLGRLPKATRVRVERELGDMWAGSLITGWGQGWMASPVRVGDLIGEAVLGARAGQVVVGDSTTVCFYKLVCAALDARPGRDRIVCDADDFPTDRYVLEAIAAARGLELVWLEFDRDAGPDADALAAALDPRTALVTFSHISYRSAHIADMRTINALAHGAGALTLWDLSHSAGSVPLALDADGCDLAVGCTYKYLNGGPGAPAFMYARAELQSDLRQPIWGWLGRRDPFLMAPGYEPADGPAALLSGTPPAIAIACVEEGVKVVAQAGIEAIRAKAVALTEFAISLADARLRDRSVTVGSPRECARRGAHVALRHHEARSLTAALQARSVIADFREPDVIRFGLSPLTTRYVDVWDGIDRLLDLLSLATPRSRQD
jgi:kynureninase